MKYYKVLNDKHLQKHFFVTNELVTEKELLRIASKECKDNTQAKKLFKSLKSAMLPIELKRSDIYFCFGARKINQKEKKVFEITEKQVKELERLYYKKMTISKKDNRYFLQSYDTIIASINCDTGIIERHWEETSNTSLNHFASFCTLCFHGKVAHYHNAGGRATFLAIDYQDKWIYKPLPYKKLNYKQPSMYYSWY